MSFGAKFGWEIAENFHWAAGVYGLLVPGFGNGDVGGGGFLFTTITGGNERYHGSLSVGLPLVFGDGEEFFDPIIVASGNVRVSNGLAFVSENWIFPAQIGRGDSFASIHSLALRFITDVFATDVGLVSVPGFDNDVPLLPWLDFTYNWGSSH